MNEISSLFEETTIVWEGIEYTVFKVKNDFKILFNVQIDDTLPAIYNSLDVSTRFNDMITISKDSLFQDLSYFDLNKSLITSTYQVSSSNEIVIYSLMNIEIFGLEITNGTELSILFNNSGIVNDKRNNSSIIDSFLKTNIRTSVNYLTSLENINDRYTTNIDIAFVI